MHVFLPILGGVRAYVMCYNKRRVTEAAVDARVVIDLVASVVGAVLAVVNDALEVARLATTLDCVRAVDVTAVDDTVNTEAGNKNLSHINTAQNISNNDLMLLRLYKRVLMLDSAGWEMAVGLRRCVVERLVCVCTVHMRVHADV